MTMSGTDLLRVTRRADLLLGESESLRGLPIGSTSEGRNTGGFSWT
jgi:hypothetical protein